MGPLAASGLSNPVHVIVLLVVIAFYVVPAYLAARLAQRKGRSFGVYLVAGLLVGWFITLIAALLVRPLPPRPAPE